MTQDKKNDKKRVTKSKPESPGPGPRDLSNFTSSQKSPVDQNEPQERRSEDLTKKSSLFCSQIHYLVDC